VLCGKRESVCVCKREREREMDLDACLRKLLLFVV
jgi:hypothetical protein